jgi:hypothetical protein
MLARCFGCRSRSRTLYLAAMLNRLFLSLAFIGVLLSQAIAHPNGISKIELNLIDPDSLQLRIDVNRDDILNIINESPSGHLNSEKAYFYQVMKKVAYYMQSRIHVEVDGRGLSSLHVVGWNKEGKSDTTQIDSVDVGIGNCVLIFAAHIPNPTGKLTMGVQLFLELGIQPLSEISVLWHGQLVQRSWLTTEKTMHLPLHRDSLATRIAHSADTTGAAPTSTSNVDGGFLRFIGLGFTHIIPHGLDHILFVLGLFFFSTLLRPLLWQITAFTVAHSLTLGLSLVGFVNLPSRIVEPLIALSIAIIAIENIFFRKLKPSRWFIVFMFGLVHGLGFAGVLKDLGIPKTEFWTTLIGFNLGVELGQLTIVSLAVFLTVWFWKKNWYFKAVVVPISTAIALIGLYWAVQRAFLL